MPLSQHQVLTNVKMPHQGEYTVVYCRRCGAWVFMTDADLAATPQRRESGDRILNSKACQIKLAAKPDVMKLHKVQTGPGSWELQHRFYCGKCALFVLYESLSTKDDVEPLIYLHVKNLMLPASAGVSKYPCPYCKRPCADEEHLKRHTNNCKTVFHKE
eukprot:Gregarina_sp_Pseudo_9__449@NODE_128_length_4108_cov_13_891865_g120_i0_p4_GENE_NODE_128_length_4108_cov_13_891865_g120_i0NODE_128_length_4108_cov_13_891865_g120_i0_p4_ORF_typecomplete_len159_score10_90GFA/PF04828_14/4_2GFA/PF04828_14/3_3GFA/PF04828_14/2_6e02GAGA/PF09237_11/0_013zfDi19/PF05605_12/35zfDi19/PF05605_12/6e03zfDi19/PF05605_12/0_26zfC2H2/PF00096_26/5_9e03zfC2H2/PF00096_26/3_6e03zfC2H2/PF00096_26/0_11zinc_ribbon_10/PF10058_9/29zinc_ribbon_10/PF10058_9/1_4e02zinc_ribbon_10/PF10058_9/38Rib